MLTGRQRQTALFYRRDNRRRSADPSTALFRTHTFAAGATNIDTAGAFGDTASRSRAISFAFTLTRSGSGDGVVVEFGSASRGFAVWLSGANMGVAAGASTGGGTSANGTSVVITNALPVTGRKYRFTIAIDPGPGRIEVWRDGKRIGSVQAAGSTFNGPWADTGNGCVGNVTGTVIDRVPLANRIAMANAALVGPISAYLHQRAHQ